MNKLEYSDIKNNKELDSLMSDLKDAAKEATEKCRFLKSTTKVGCSILTNNQEIVWGCNFDYEWGIARHAEDCAITNMIIACRDDSLIRAVYLYVEDKENFTPCGNCRDKIKLFAENKDDTFIYLDNGKYIKVFRLGELFPYSPER